MATFSNALRLLIVTIQLVGCLFLTDKFTWAEDSLTTELSTSQLEFFEKQVRPLLVERCYECHSAKEKNGGLLLDSREGVMTGGDSGAAVVPGKPKESRLVEAIKYSNPNLQMPPKGKLTEAEILVLEKWVELGVPDPRETPATTPTSLTGMSIEEGRRFWSLQPVSKIALPEVQSRRWVKSPIDLFVLAKLEAAGLKPAPRADKRTLIRRATQDLIGLPPTPQEVQAFLDDKSPNAFDQVVERLINSPHYGTRWGRHWLDVARYADSNGLDENLAFGNAWRYRDYVINAFNRDKPFDRFVMEQIAGDLIPDANQETRTATGFLAMGAKVLAEPDREKLLMDTIDEQIDSTSKAFLGMTWGCARCHDHKFDPIKQSDYYAIAAIFKSTQTFGDSNTGAIKHWYEHSFATQDEAAKLKTVDEAIAAKNSAAAKFRNEAIETLRTKARELAAEYLAAAAMFDPNASLVEVEKVANPRKLHPRILHYCRLHLEYNADQPIFAKWHELLATGNSSEASKVIEEYYRALFAEADDAWKAAKQADDKVRKLADARLEEARQALEDKSGFLAIPPQPQFAFDPATLQEYYRLMEEARVLESSAPDETAAMGVSEGKIYVSLPIHIRGSHNNLGDPIEREFPQVLRIGSGNTVFPRVQSGRLEFAQWLVNTQNPLTARVMVNRVWRWHFGRGIVGSTDNFGVLGERPTHPELLDWLARWFMESGWSIKSLHRLIMKSSVYQLASIHPQTADCELADPENQLLWQFRRQRLDAEQIRDSILYVCGQLDGEIGGKTVPLRNRQFVFNHTSVDHTKYDSLRRAIYLPVIRNNLYTLFEQFDFPDPTMPTGSRNTTTVAPQALLLMNDELVVNAAQKMAEQLLQASEATEKRINEAYQRTLSRPPNPSEQERAIQFIEHTFEQAKSDNSKTWTLFCQSLLMSSEFVYVR